MYLDLDSEALNASVTGDEDESIPASDQEVYKRELDAPFWKWRCEEVQRWASG